MIGLLVFIAVLSILIIVHEFGHFIAARRVGVRVEKFSLGFGKVLWKKKSGDTEYSIAAVPLGGFVKMAGDSAEEYKGNKDEYFSKTPGERFKIIFWGPLLNYVLGFLCFWLIFFVGYPTLTTKVGGLLDGYGAKAAGIQVGDKILSVDGKPVAHWEDLQKEIQRKKSAPSVKISVLRADKEFSVEVPLKKEEFEDALGKKRSFGLLGVSPFDELVKVRHGFLQSFVLGVNKTWELTVMTYEGLWYMVTGRLSMRDSMTGPLGIFYITSKAAKVGFVAVLHLVAVLSVSLAIFNLLPLPILDGGHILFLGLEKIRGRALSLKFENIVNRIGMTLIVSLALFVTYNDIMRLFGDKIHKLFGG